MFAPNPPSVGWLCGNWVVNACDPKAGVVDGAVAPNENAGFGCACWPSDDCPNSVGCAPNAGAAPAFAGCDAPKEKVGFGALACPNIDGCVPKEGVEVDRLR